MLGRSSKESQRAMTDKLQKVRQHYGHFHRVLGELLTTLVDQEHTHWLTPAQGHTITPDGQDNGYHKAIYALSNLEPYKDALSKLAAVQTDVLQLLGRSKATPGVLLPTVLEGVQFIRLNAHTNRISERLEKPQTLGRLDKLITQQQTNLDQFRRHQTLHDPRFDKVAAELKALEDARKRIKASKEETFRFRTAQAKVLPYIYLQDGGVATPYVNDHGLLAVGPEVTITVNTARRRGRSDKIDAPTLFDDGYITIYEESTWQAGKEAAGTAGASRENL